MCSPNEAPRPWQAGQGGEAEYTGKVLGPILSVKLRELISIETAFGAPAAEVLARRPSEAQEWLLWCRAAEAAENRSPFAPALPAEYQPRRGRPWTRKATFRHRGDRYLLAVLAAESERAYAGQ
jgi:hypothetical protein